MEILLNNFSKNLNSRSLVHKIFDSATINDSLTVNFDGIHEATPSFCHEMLNFLIVEKKIKLKITNTNDSIKAQLNKALSSTQKTSKMVK